MGNRMVMGIIPFSSIETAINNLTEADFDESTISLVLKDAKLARQIIDDQGPLKGATLSNLQKKLSEYETGNKTQAYITSIQKGNALIAISVPEEAVDAAEEMLSDYDAELVIVI
jgi:hypothetical protein